MLFKIADFYIEIEFLFSYNEALLAEYISPEPHCADFFIKTTESDIDTEAENFARSFGDLECSRGYLERVSLSRKICAEFLSRDTFVMHGALIEYDGRGYLFSAPSGTGKTTHVLLWQELFGKENVKIINGDKPFIRHIDGKLYAYGSPWCGKENFNINTRVLLSAVCFIERDAKNSIEPMGETAALQKVLGQLDITGSADLGKQLELAGVLVEKIPIYKLRCNMSAEAAQVAYDAIKE